MIQRLVRSQQLDALRGVAILLVLSRHPVVTVGEAGRFSGLAWFGERFGWTGVDLFFVLSGFLIGGLLFKEIQRDGTLDVSRFLIRRGFKIWPAYLVFLVFAITMGYRHTIPHIDGVKPLVPNLLHLQNYLGTSQWTTWSLAVEEHFYLLLPLLLLVLIRSGRLHLLPALVFTICVVCLGLRFLNLRRPFHFFTHVSPTHLRVDGLCFGVLLSYLYHFKPRFVDHVTRHRTLLLLCGLVLVSPMVFMAGERAFVWTIGFTLLYLGYACILMACADAVDGPVGWTFHNPAAKLVAFIGFYSYSIYLWFYVVAYNLVRLRFGNFGMHGSRGWLVATAAYVAIAVVVGIVMAKLVELPALAIRDRLFPSRSRVRPTAKLTPDRLFKERGLATIEAAEQTARPLSEIL